MHNVCWATPLYAYLRMCNASTLPKVVLDCGAGGSEPPLSLFSQFGYKIYGVEIAENSLMESRKFGFEHQVDLQIVKGDMRSMPFPDAYFSFVYSYNAIDFMTKPDIAVSMSEITRVLRQDGLCYVNFLSVDDQETWEPFCNSGPAYSLLKSETFAHFEDDEADVYFKNYVLLRKEKRLTDKLFEGRVLKRAEIDYIAKIK